MVAQWFTHYATASTACPQVQKKMHIQANGDRTFNFSQNCIHGYII